MVEYVRSDYTISLKIRTPDGETLHAGTHTRVGGVDELGREVPVSHLHRVDPGGRMLASFDADRGRVQLRDLSSSLSAPLELELEGLTGAVTQLRWRGDGRGFVVVTTDNAWLVPWDPQARPTKLVAQPVFVPATHGVDHVLDTRMMKSGFIAETTRTVQLAAWSEPRREIWYVRVADDLVQDIELLNPGTDVQIANLRSDDRIVMVVESPDDDDAEASSQQLLTLRPRADGPAEIVETHDCFEREWCHVVNWTPDTARLGYALMSGSVVLEGEAGAAALELPMMQPEEEERFDFWVGNIHTLWANAAEDRIVAANDVRVRAWDDGGRTQWTWDAKRGQKVRSAQFDTDGRAVLAAVDRRIVRIADGRARTVVRERLPRAVARAPEGEHAWSRTVYIDDVTPLPLPDGRTAIAYMLVELHTRSAAWTEVTAAHPELGSDDEP
jgi:hypothetical protein